MEVQIISTFRNSLGYLQRYFNQMDNLARSLMDDGHILKLLLGYGDGTDKTGEILYEEASHRLYETVMIGVAHGGKDYGSIENPERFKNLAFVGNKLLDNASTTADIIGFVESDLIWKPITMRLLIHQVYNSDVVGAMSPMIMDGPNSFYDVFAFRRAGKRFTKNPPYFPDEAVGDGRRRVVGSSGSVIFVKGDIARKCRLSEEEAIVGFCKDVMCHGGVIWLDTSLEVYHPPYRENKKSGEKNA